VKKETAELYRKQMIMPDLVFLTKENENKLIEAGYTPDENHTHDNKSKADEESPLCDQGNMDAGTESL
jgi:hypothetical protein